MEAKKKRSGMRIQYIVLIIILIVALTAVLLIMAAGDQPDRGAAPNIAGAPGLWDGSIQLVTCAAVVMWIVVFMPSVLTDVKFWIHRKRAARRGRPDATGGKK